MLCNVHPLFREALKPVMPAAPVAVTPAMRAYTVEIKAFGEKHDVNVLAATARDAVNDALDIFFDGDEAMPTDGLEVRAYPTQFKKVA